MSCMALPIVLGCCTYCKRGLHGSVSQTAASIASSASKPTCKWINHQHARKRSIYSRLSRAKRGERDYWTYIALTDCNQSSVWWVITWRLPRFNSLAAGIETFQQLRHLRNVGDDKIWADLGQRLPWHSHLVLFVMVPGIVGVRIFPR